MTAWKKIKTDETGSERGTRVGAAQNEFRTIRLARPRQHDLVEAMVQLLASSTGRSPATPTRGLVVIQPSGTGKSEAAKQLASFVEATRNPAPGDRPVLHVTLDTTGSPKSAVASCLEELGDEYATEGTEQMLMKRFRLALVEKKVEILIIDELNHCAAKVLGKDVSNTLKNMLTKGWVPIVMMGTSAAERLFKDNRELRNRCEPNLSLTPLDHAIPADAEEWDAFLAGMDVEIVTRGLLDRPCGLDEPTLAGALCRACAGLIGEVCLVLEDALCAAVRRGDPAMDLADLHRAVEVRYVLPGHLSANPLDAVVK